MRGSFPDFAFRREQGSTIANQHRWNRRFRLKLQSHRAGCGEAGGLAFWSYHKMGWSSEARWVVIQFVLGSGTDGLGTVGSDSETLSKDTIVDFVLRPEQAASPI